MMSFKQYTETQMRRKYIALHYNQRTQRDLRYWAQMHGFPLDHNFLGQPQQANQFIFHTTLFYSTSRHIMANGTWSYIPTTVQPTEFEMLGEDYDIPVLRVESSTLGWLRNLYSERWGMKDEWPDYKPHISLSYKRNPNYPTPPLPQFPLVFDRITVEDIVSEEA